MSEGLLRFARNDQRVVCHQSAWSVSLRGPFPKQSPHFHKENLVAVVLR